MLIPNKTVLFCKLSGNYMIFRTYNLLGVSGMQVKRIVGVICFKITALISKKYGFRLPLGVVIVAVPDGFAIIISLYADEFTIVVVVVVINEFKSAGVCFGFKFGIIPAFIK